MIVLLCALVGAAIGGLTAWLMFRPVWAGRRRVALAQAEGFLAHAARSMRQWEKCPLCVDMRRRDRPHPCDSVKLAP